MPRRRGLCHRLFLCNGNRRGRGHAFFKHAGRRQLRRAQRQGIRHNGRHGLGHGIFVLEAHFPFVGVHVYVHVLKRHGQIQHAHRKTPNHHALAAGLLHRAAEQLAAHGAAIEEKALVAAVGARGFAHAHKAIQHQTGLRAVHADQLS